MLLVWYVTLQETGPLRNHSVRPGQLLVFFERVTLAKLAVRRDVEARPGGRRGGHLLVPLTHAGQFRRTSPPAAGALRLTELSRSPLGYPFTLTYRHDDVEYRNLEDDLLPATGGHLLTADGIVDEDCVIVARMNEFDALTAARPTTTHDDTALVNADDAFHLPLRTRLTVYHC